MIRSTVFGAEDVCRRGQHQMSGLGGGQGKADRLQIAHLADQDDVRIFPQRRPQGVGETRRVAANLPLGDQTAARRVNELDGVFDGEDVLPPRGVDVIHERRQRGALARPRGARDQHQAVRRIGDAAKDRPHPQRRHVRHFERQRAERRARPAVVPIGVDAIAPDVRQLEAEVPLRRLDPARFGRDFLQRTANPSRIERPLV